VTHLPFEHHDFDRLQKRLLGPVVAARRLLILLAAAAAGVMIDLIGDGGGVSNWTDDEVTCKTTVKPSS